jgi:hypothetical protein
MATDIHIERDIIFKDFTSMGLFIEPKGSITLHINRFDFALEVAYRHIARTRGSTQVKEGIRDYYLSLNDSGASLSLLDARFLVRIRI